MNQIKKLAGQTAIYGIPSIVGRILNYLLVPLYTRVLDPAEYGTVILMYSFVAVIFIVLTYGMETAFFRYAELEKDKKKVFGTTFLSLLGTTAIFLLFVLFFPGQIASWIKYPGFGNYITWLGLIISLDVLSSIPFAKLRADNKPRRFALVKIINIAVNIGFNLFFILLCPYVLNNYESGVLHALVRAVFDPEASLIAYVFLSNLIASAITLLLLLPEVLKLKLQLDPKLWKKLILYGFPLLFAGLAGVMNETLGRILIRYLLPEEIAEAQLGIYSASYKIAILMSLFIQAFRYAAEPFFFSYAKQKDSRQVYAMVMHYFVISILLIFLAITLFLDIVILILGEEFRSAKPVIPILLYAYMFLGIYYNLSVWYKLTNKTQYGALMASIGALTTILFNILWIPSMGYTGSAWATFICYATMMLTSFLMMRKYFPIRYPWLKMCVYFALATMLFISSSLIEIQNRIMDLSINAIFLLIFIMVVWIFEGKSMRALFRRR